MWASCSRSCGIGRPTSAWQSSRYSCREPQTERRQGTESNFDGATPDERQTTGQTTTATVKPERASGTDRCADDVADPQGLDGQAGRQQRRVLGPEPQE